MHRYKKYKNLKGIIKQTQNLDGRIKSMYLNLIGNITQNLLVKRLQHPTHSLSHHGYATIVSFC